MQKSRKQKLPSVKLPVSAIDGIIREAGKKSNKPSNVTLNSLGLPDVATSVSERLKNNDDIVALFPDVELSIQILSSSILSPNDMSTTSLIYTPPEIEIPSEINNVILNTIKTYMDKEYKLKDKLMDILRESLFTKGAYIEAVLPADKIMSVITPNSDSGEVSLESIDKEIIENGKSLGILGGTCNTDKKITLSTEDIDVDIDTPNGYSEDDLGLHITDTPSEMFIGKEFMKLTTESLEDALYNTELSVEEKMYKRVNKLNKTVDVVKIDYTETGDGNDKATIIKLPAVATVPVHLKSDPSNHIGYFILLDESGTPINTSTTLNNMKAQEDLLYASDVKSAMITKAKHALKGITKKDALLKDVEDLYIKLAKDMVNKRVATGIYGDTVEAVEEYDLYKVMFFRALANQKTKVMFLPKEYVSYMAFDYRENGTGKSLIEKVAMLFSIRSILLISRLMGNMKNSVTTTEVTATLDEDDHDPQATMEKIISETLKTRQTQIPIGITKVDDLVDWAHKVGFRYNIKHPALPDMSIDVSESNTSKAVPDTDLDESIQEYIIMSFGLTKDMVLAGYDPEYATIAITNNVLLAKRVMVLQDKLSAMLSKHLTKILRSDTIIKNAITNIITSNLKPIKSLLKKRVVDKELVEYFKKDENVISYVLNGYLKHVNITLPKPEVKENTNMKEAFETYKDTVDDILDVIISSDAIPDGLSGEISDNMDDIKAAMRTMLVKEWNSNNNYVPEINNFLTLDNTGKPVFDILDDYNVYIEQLTATILPFFKKNKKFIDKTNEALDKIEEGEQEEDTENTPDGDEDTGGTTSDGGDTGTDDAGGGEDTTGVDDEDTGVGEVNLDDL